MGARRHSDYLEGVTHVQDKVARTKRYFRLTLKFALPGHFSTKKWENA